MVKKLKKQYDTPNEGWDEERINREIQLMDDYGLKNKREIYKAQSQLRDLRQEARNLVASENETERKELIRKTNRLGLVRQDAELEEILSLNLTDLLDRRLQTAVDRRGYTDTVKEARQLVVHGHVYVDGQRVTVPGYLLTQDEEKEIEVRKPEPPEEPEEEETGEADEEPEENDEEAESEESGEQEEESETQDEEDETEEEDN
jgi:small subunit ribosomal protein S4